MAVAADVAAAASDVETMDTQLLVGEEGAVVQVHKFILISRSTVFRSMFAHKLTEQQTGTVQLTDASLDAVRAFVFFLYTDELDNVAPLEEMLMLANKYEVRALRDTVLDQLKTQVSVSNLVPLVELCCMYSLPTLEAILAPIVHGNVLLHGREDVRELTRRCPEAGLLLLRLKEVGGLLGTWRYKESSARSFDYTIKYAGGSDAGAGLLFEQETSSGTVSGVLIGEGEWFQGQLAKACGETHGFFRVKQTAVNQLSSNFRSSEELCWGADTVAAATSTVSLGA